MISKDKTYPFQSTLFSLIIGFANLVNPAIKAVKSSDGLTLTLYNISESDIGKLKFPVNTAHNHDKLSFVDAQVFLVSNPTADIFIPGFKQQMVLTFGTKNSLAYSNHLLTFKPFEKIPTRTGDLTVPELTDILSGITSYTQPTKGNVKLYTLVFRNEIFPVKKMDEDE
jgi:hypothetical protein